MNESRFQMLAIAAIFASLMFVPAGPVRAGELVVPAQANIFGAGHASAPAPAGSGGGTVPPSVSLSGGVFVTFQATGQVSYNGANFYGPDGAQYLGAHTALDSYGGISGIHHDSRIFFLVGVFLNDAEPSGSAPPILDFTNDGFTEIAPQLNQTFFIGDGLEGTGAGNSQQFEIPAGATRMFLGFADGIDFTGPPGSYGDNVGNLDVTDTVTVPEPTVVAGSMVAALLILLARARRVMRH
jgi:hypothetical protein